jgi:hypothetical protein
MANQCTGSLSSPKAAGSTSQGASLQCIPGFGFGKASTQSRPFVLIAWLILVESQEKPKQTPPNALEGENASHL